MSEAVSRPTSADAASATWSACSTSDACWALSWARAAVNAFSATEPNVSASRRSVVSWMSRLTVRRVARRVSSRVSRPERAASRSRAAALET